MIPRLAYITDGSRGTRGRPQAEVIRCAVKGGVRLVVLRALELPEQSLLALTEELLPLRSCGVSLVVSRRLDIAHAYGLEGVHLAADAVSVQDARRWLGPEFLIGYSAHSAEEAREAAAAGASYVTLSPIYATQSKPGAKPVGATWLAQATRDLPIPALALGGITHHRVAEVIHAGAWGAAVVSAVGAAPDVEQAAREMARAIEEAIA